jgi:cytochrome P450
VGERTIDGGEPSPFAIKDRLSGVGVVDNPHPRLHELRATCPVHRGSPSGLFGTTGPDNYIIPDDEQLSVLTFTEADRAFRDSATYSNSYYEHYLRTVIGKTILEMDPPEHHRFRTLIQGAFTKPAVARWEDDFAREIIASYLDALAPNGRGDLAADFAFHYPIAVTAAAVGLGIDDVETFYEQATLLTNVAIDQERRLGAAAELGALVRTLIAERRREPTGDLISVLVGARFREAGEGADRLTDDEIVAFVRLLVPAGAQTTYRTLTNLLYALLMHPEQLAALRADRSLIPQAIEEGLRWESPLLSFGRTATLETSIAGQPVEAGKVVNLCVHAANRDPSRWERPDEFDIFREPRGHLGFGQGNHLCLGIHFARMELRVALELVLDRLPGLRLDPDVPCAGITGLAARTAVNLPCIWDVPEGAAE